MILPVAALRWSDVTDGDLDHYEVRSGTGWMNGRVVYRGRAPSCEVPASLGDETFQVRARLRSGRQSPEAALLTITTATPAGWVAASGGFPRDEVALAWPGTHAGTEVSADGYLVLSATSFAGTYTTPALGAGATGFWLWSVVLDSWQRDLSFTGEDWTAPGDSGASLDRSGEGTEPTALDPGADLEADSALWSEPGSEAVGDGHSRNGEVGRRTSVLLEASFSNDGSTWSDWVEWRTSMRSAGYVRYRLTLRRQHPLRFDVQVRVFHAEAARADLASLGVISQGRPGIDGEDGERGERGAPGPTGPTGATGAAGADGKAGADGAAGASGAAGRPGFDGLDGEDGAPGVPGPSGPAGVAGLQGRPGIDGEDGDPGVGLPGPAGAQGAQGIQGRPGIDGEDGGDPFPSPALPTHASNHAATGSDPLRWRDVFRYRTQHFDHDEFTAVSLPGWSQTTGSGGGAYQTVTTYSAQDVDHCGIGRVDTGATSGGYCHLYRSTVSHLLGGGWVFEALIQLRNDNTGFIARLGWGDATGGGDHVDGAYFEYDKATSSFWRIVTASNSSRNKQTTSTSVTFATWVRLKIVWNSATDVQFYINGTSVGSSTAGTGGTGTWPTASGRDCGVQFFAKNGATSAFSCVDIDYFECYRDVSR